MVEIRDFSGISKPIHKQMGIELSKFHREFLEFVDNPKVTTNPTTKLLNHFYQNKKYDYPTDIYEMMEKIPKGYKEGDPEYKFIQMMENEKAGRKRKAQNCIRYLKLFTGKPQDTAGGGSRVDFFKYLIENFGVVQTIEMYNSNMRNYGDKYTLAYVIKQGLIHEEEVDLETLRELHHNASIEYQSERVATDEESESEETEEQNEEQIESRTKTSNQNEEDGDVFIQIGSYRVIADSESKAFKELSKKISKKEGSLSNTETDTDKQLTIEFTNESTIVSYGNITGIKPTLSQALQSISKQVETNSSGDDFEGNNFI